MYPHTHFIAAFALSEIAVSQGLMTHEQAFISATLAVGMDIDHYIYYIKTQKSLNFLKAWNFCSGKDVPSARGFIHHLKGIFLMSLFCLALSFYLPTWFWIIVVAYFSHIILDQYPSDDYEPIIRFNIFRFYLGITLFEIIIDALIIAILIMLFI